MVPALAFACPICIPSQGGGIPSLERIAGAGALVLAAPQEPAVITQTRFTPVVDAPVPPARPFDLDTIGGAASPVMPGSLPAAGSLRPTGAPLPPARPTDLSFIAREGGFTRFGAGHPFSQFDRFDSLQPSRGGTR